METRPTIPLCVDLDGTLVKSDVLLEILLAAIKRRDMRLLHFPAWLAKGLPFTKRRLAELVPFNASTLPYNQEVLQYIQNEHAHGRQLVLATASDMLIAQKVSAHLGIFSQVFASEGVNNLSARHKAARLKKEFGDKGFDYIGNERRDVSVWRHARTALLVNPTYWTLQAAQQVAPLGKVFQDVARNRWQAWLAALRPYQWVKNILIFMPLLAAHDLWDVTKLGHTVVAFVAFSLCASAFYLLNDLFDLANDREHPTKKRRPLAAGEISITTALASIPLLLVLSFALALMVNPAFILALLAYTIGTCSYSWYFKERLLVDVLALALLYVLRVVAGGLASAVPISFWFLAFALFMFFTLALVKRIAEISRMSLEAKAQTNGRAYQGRDKQLLLSLAAASGCMAVLVLALYINSDQVVVLYRRPFLLWLLCPTLFYWVSRVLLLADRGRMSDDPILFAFKDKVSYLAGALILALLLVAA